eukprot:1196062-Prorocentrum_minimum.AAC.1
MPHVLQYLEAALPEPIERRQPQAGGPSGSTREGPSSGSGGEAAEAGSLPGLPGRLPGLPGPSPLPPGYVASAAADAATGAAVAAAQRRIDGCRQVGRPGASTASWQRQLAKTRGGGVRERSFLV